MKPFPIFVAGLITLGSAIAVTSTGSAQPTGDTARKAMDSRIAFSITATPDVVRPGETVKLTITGTPARGFHTYPVSFQTPNQIADSTIVFDPSTPFQPIWEPFTESQPEIEGTGEDASAVHAHEFTWVLDVLVKPDARPGSHALKLTVKGQTCDDKGCVPFTRPLETTLTVKDEPAVAPAADIQGRLKASGPAMKTLAEPLATPDAGRPGGASRGLSGFILAGIFWGFMSLITPCVFPMIPITVSFFLKQAEKENHRPVLMALVYSGTIVIVLTIAAVTLLSFFRWLSTNPIMNIGLGLLFIFFALSLFGWYEIELPSGLAQFTSAREGQGGLVGTVFMALTFTIISFACVAPFLGGFGGTADTSQLTWMHRILGGLAFSATFAAPFLVLALFPALLKKMPKSGTWLNSVKVVMGFLELAAAFVFLRTGELVLLDKPVLFTYDMVLGLYVAISFLCGLYLLNFYRLPHDTPVENLSVPRMLFSLAFLALGFYLMPALFKDGKTGENQRPTGAVFAWMDAFLLPDSQGSELPWTGDLQRGLAAAKDAPSGLAFVDFTGKSCKNCKYNEKNVFNKREVQDLLKKYSLVQLYTDVVPNELYPLEIRNQLSGVSRQRQDAEANLALQRDRFGDEQLPLYVILAPLPDGKWREVARYDEGKINNEAAFVAFLTRYARPGNGAAQAQLTSGR